MWTAPGRKAKTFKTGEGCNTGTIPYHVVEVALGGGQVAWIGEGGGNSLEMLMHVAKLSGGRARQVEYANNSNGAAGDPRGDWVGELLGGGPLLVYNRWKAVCTVPPDYGCSWTEPTLRVVQQRLFRIAAGRRVVVKRGSGSYPVSAVGGGRMAVEAAGTVTLLGPSGGRVAAVPRSAGQSASCDRAEPHEARGRAHTRARRSRSRDRHESEIDFPGPGGGVAAHRRQLEARHASAGRAAWSSCA